MFLQDLMVQPLPYHLPMVHVIGYVINEFDEFMYIYIAINTLLSTSTLTLKEYFGKTCIHNNGLGSHSIVQFCV